MWKMHNEEKCNYISYKKVSEICRPAASLLNTRRPSRWRHRTRRVPFEPVPGKGMHLHLDEQDRVADPGVVALNTSGWILSKYFSGERRSRSEALFAFSCDPYRTEWEKSPLHVYCTIPTIYNLDVLQPRKRTRLCACHSHRRSAAIVNHFSI